jgi:hypothetical protein
MITNLAPSNSGPGHFRVFVFDSPLVHDLFQKLYHYFLPHRFLPPQHTTVVFYSYILQGSIVAYFYSFPSVFPRVGTQRSVTHVVPTSQVRLRLYRQGFFIVYGLQSVYGAEAKVNNWCTAYQR